jgi:hypothetical protein
MAPPRKRSDQRQDNRQARELVVLAGGAGVSVPQARDEWRDEMRTAWDEFWSSDVAQAIEVEHLPALRRLFEMRDLQSRAWERYRAQPYVDGSMGQPVTNPAFAEATKLESACVALEDRLGLSPKARANLGIAIGQAALTAADLNRMAQEGDSADADDVLEVEGWEAVN